MFAADAKQQFMAWVQKRHPKVYARAKGNPRLMREIMQTRRPERTEWAAGRFVLSAVTPAPAPTQPSWADKIVSLATPLLQLKQQRDIFKLQAQRAAQGLPPLNVEEYTPAVRVQAGVDKSLQMPLMIAGVGLGVGALLLFARGRRRG